MFCYYVKEKMVCVVISVYKVGFGRKVWVDSRYISNESELSNISPILQMYAVYVKGYRLHLYTATNHTSSLPLFPITPDGPQVQFLS